MPQLDIDVSGVEKTLNAIERDIHRGMERSVENLVENAKDRARQVISENDAIFNAEVYRGFRDAETRNNSSNVSAKLYNDVGHAEVLEDGAAFPDEGPPVEALLPWVARKMRVGNSFDPDGYGGSDGFPDSFDGGDDGDGGGASNKTGNVTLDVDGEIREYPDSWNTYDPTQVDKVPNQDTFVGQEVEVLDIDTEEFYRGHISSRERTRDYYEVDLDDGRTVTVYEPHTSSSDPYKIIGAESFDSLESDIQESIHKQAVDRISTPDFGDGREKSVKNTLKSRFYDTHKEKKMALDVAHKTKNIYEKTGSSAIGSMGSRSDGYSMGLASTAGKSTILHEATHGVHRNLDYNRAVYPDNDDDWFNNLFNADGTNATENGTWELGEVLLGNDSRTDIPGLPDDGSIPDIIRERVEADSSGYNYDPIDSVPDLLNPNNDNLEPGDRIKMTSPGSAGVMEHEYLGSVVRDYDLDGIEYEGDHITSLDFRVVGEDQKIELWVDEAGEFVNMREVVVESYSPKPDGYGPDIPDVHLSRDDDWERLIEASNLAFMEMVWTASQLEAEETVGKDVVSPVGRPYSMRAANETFTVVTELLRASNPSGKIKEKEWLSSSKIRELDNHYPYLIDAWLDNYNPSEGAAKVLRELGYDV